MNVVVVYESLTGNTRRAAELIGGAANARGAEVVVQALTAQPVATLDLEAIAHADVVFVGTWVDGLVLFGQRPGRASKLRALPVLDGKRVAAFCTYAINPGRTIDKLAAILEAKGATVVARRAIKRGAIDNQMAADFVGEVLAAIPA